MDQMGKKIAKGTISLVMPLKKMLASYNNVGP